MGVRGPHERPRRVEAFRFWRRRFGVAKGPRRGAIRPLLGVSPARRGSTLHMTQATPSWRRAVIRNMPRLREQIFFLELAEARQVEMNARQYFLAATTAREIIERELGAL